MQVDADAVSSFIVQHISRLVGFTYRPHRKLFLLAVIPFFVLWSDQSDSQGPSLRARRAQHCVGISPLSAAPCRVSTPKPHDCNQTANEATHKTVSTITSVPQTLCPTASLLSPAAPAVSVTVTAVTAVTDSREW